MGGPDDVQVDNEVDSDHNDMEGGARTPQSGDTLKTVILQSMKVKKKLFTNFI